MVIIVFICVLTGARFLWSSLFTEETDVRFTDGELDLRDGSLEQSGVRSLDGEWLFYSNVFIEKERNDNVPEGELIEVPSNWSDYTDEKGAEGYGTYQLRILLDPEDDTTYSLRIPSVRSSSEIYVNNRLLAHAGEVGENSHTYQAGNKPQTIYFTAENGVIDLVIHVANFDDPRGGGLIRSIKFGKEDVLSKQTNLSITLQLVTFIILLINSLYAFTLFILGDKDKRLLYFSLFTLSYSISFALSSEDKLLYLWFDIPYTFAFQLTTMIAVVIAFTLLKSLERDLPHFLQKVVKRSVIPFMLSIIIILVLPLKQMLVIQPLFILIMMLSIGLSFVTVFRISLKHIARNLLLLLSLISFTSHIVWWGISLVSGEKVIYYPFDLITAIILLAIVWFHHYLERHRETQRVYEKLQETDKMKDVFLANTSHELRNPLHAVLNMSHAVLEREEKVLAKESVRDLETVLSVGRRMSNMLDDLLDHAALKERRIQLEQKPFYVQSVAHGVLDMFYSMTEGKPVQLKNQIPEDFPAVYGDEERVIQVLLNLVHNSVKYTKEGTISIDGYVKKSVVCIEVTDTGIGMSQDAIRTLFEPYEQINEIDTMMEGGFGLGLSISKQLVELHGGELQVRSTRGEGSTFTFSIPLANEEQTDAAESDAAPIIAERKLAPMVSGEEQTQDRDLAVDKGRPHILVVDDDPVNLQVVETILSNEHYDMTLVTSGEQALSVLYKKEWDLVISDVMMPNMSGYTLTREIREKFTLTDLPVLLLTARNQLSDIENGFLSGANDYVTKPVDALELRARVQALTSLKRTMRDHLHMEAAWLQAQIQPHFLFNALNAIIALSEIDPVRMRAMLEAFSTFLRGKFRFQQMNDLIAIEEEIELVETYLYIEQERFGDRLQVVWDIEEETKDVHIPSLTIQPLVENAIHHGIMEKVEGGTIYVRIYKKGADVKVSIEDNGVGIQEEVLAQLLTRKMSSTKSVGLLNTHLRLQRQYGQGLHIESSVNNGTIVSFQIPLYED